jgi:hypothetical protein
MADPAAYAQAQIDEWHSRLKVGGSARPSPTIAVAQRAGYERLVVERGLPAVDPHTMAIDQVGAKKCHINAASTPISAQTTTNSAVEEIMAASPFETFLASHG